MIFHLRKCNPIQGNLQTANSWLPDTGSDAEPIPEPTGSL